MSEDAISFNDMASTHGSTRGVSERHWKLAVALVGAIALAAGLAVVDRLPVGVFHDDAMYVILARSLATGQGYRYLNIPGAPLATHFPPGYPALLAVLWRVAPHFPENVVLFKTMNAAFFCASAVIVSMFARERLQSAPWAIVVGLLSAVSVPLLVLVTMVLSEPLFLAMLLAILLIAERFVEGDAAFASAAVLGASIGVLTLVRTHGIVVMPAVVLPLLLRRRFADSAAVAAATIAILVPWQWWSTTHAGTLPLPLEGNYGSYIGWWMRGFHASGAAMIPATLSRTVPELGGMFAALFSPVRGASAHVATLVALVALFALSAAMLARRAPVTLLFLLGYAAIVLVWPFPPSRFAWGIWPLILLVLVGPMTARMRGPRRRMNVPHVAVLLAFTWVAVGYLSYERRAIRGEWWASVSRSAARRIAPAVAWSLAHTTASDVVAADDEGSIFLYAGRRSVPVASFTTDHYLGNRTAETEAAEGLVGLLAEYPIRVVLVGSSRTFDAAAFLASRPVPILTLREQFAGGAAFTVTSR